ncbi:retrovirus-related Pol polyprotein from transposon 297 [Trichonephila clavipes]|uniref:Retrovirus-related Pol polyprotein from transposon 297 n=1 Tax=Trichonephila clavipes TaxID=2585209 RepID=A0A8X6VR43_TRICX|nr:retrovirus-related Pol polyprotein from transposon 297 [Trichonephila clavipes]
MGALKLSEFNTEWEHRPGAQIVVADVLSRNPVDNVEGSQILCTALRALALNSREQLTQEQREDPELGHIYSYLENPDDGSVNATVCGDWSQDFQLIDGLLFYVNYFTSHGELRVYIPQSLREAIMHEFHDQPLAGHLGKKRTVIHQVKIDPKISAPKIAASTSNTLGRSVSAEMVRRVLRKAGYNGRVARKKLLIGKRNRVKRLKSAKEHILRPQQFLERSHFQR